MQGMSANPTPIEVMKFGGTSLGDAGRILASARLALGERSGRRLVVVGSAMAGVTNTLIDAATAAARGERELGLRLLEEIRRRHDAALDDLIARTGRAEGSGDVRAELHAIVTELEDLVRGIVAVTEITPRMRDRVVGAGEKLAVRLLALALRSIGQAARALDADRFLETDGRFGNATPLAGVAERGICATLEPLLQDGEIPIVTGFIGHAPDGATTTFSRGGSDYTATILGAALGAERVTIWTDVDGVYSADPRIVPEARPVAQLNYREAGELSYYGAKVLHQRTIIPVAKRGIPVVIRNSFAPENSGTVVDGRFSPGSHPVKAISAVRGQALVSIEGNGMAGVPGIAARVFGTLARAEISVTMISQSSSESSICLAVPESDAVAAELALKRGLRDELACGDVEEVTARRDVALIAAVGLGMAHTPGIAARTFAALARRRVNVLAIAQGSSELNLSLAVDGDDGDEAVRAIHDEFELQKLDTGETAARRIDLLLIGLGSIGQTLLRLLEERAEHMRLRFGLEPRVVAIADRSGFVFRATGLPPGELGRIRAAKARREPLPDLTPSDEPAVAMLRHATRFRLARPVLIDLSDGDGMEALFIEALRAGCDVVTANKKPLSGATRDFRLLHQEAGSRRRLLKAEATVGAGLPIMDTLEMLLATGDRLLRAEGCLSGTLGFVMTRLEEGARFSDAVEEAAEAGYTEPDPVVDLCGLDVARKGLILGRISGLALDPEELTRTGLVEPELAGRDRQDLRAALKPLDLQFSRLRDEARARGEVLRYVARIAPGEISVGLEAVPLDAPLGLLRGTDNRIVFRSERYDARPLVLSGPGAGAEVTAMGVLSDLFRIAAERGGR
ncbi:MAG: bifunctional aspartate kinase/homoserine dehydrogenase I [Candidatus Eisenbacteria bacterium]|nr:bifunctional aspartate kinase/homoserine dehydrogenase I [Candidatus Eisenbacteria bacterium]